MKQLQPRVEFHCPKCLSTFYGTSGWDNMDTATRYCNGHEGRCKFKWPVVEDWRYFYIVQITKFESKDEFDKKEVGY